MELLPICCDMRVKKNCKKKYKKTVTGFIFDGYILSYNYATCKKQNIDQYMCFSLFCSYCCRVYGLTLLSCFSF